MKGMVFYNYITRHSFLVSFFFTSRILFFCLRELALGILQTSLVSMKAKKQEEYFEGWLQATNVAFKEEVNKLEREKKS